MENQNTESQTPNVNATQSNPPIHVSEQKNNNSVIIVLCLLITILVGVSAYLYGVNQGKLQSSQSQNNFTLNSPTEIQESPPSTIALKSTNTSSIPTNWKSYTDSVLGISYKLPPKLALLDKSGKEVPAERGTQYCAIYVGSLSFFSIQKVFAGTGACGGGTFEIGTVSKDYVAGREGGFGDFTGYIKQNGLYFLRFIDTVSKTSLAQGVAVEQTNSFGISYLRITGKNQLYDRGGEMMDGPTYGTPGKGFLGAIINIANTKYAGFNIQMEIKNHTDELIFDQILSTIRFTQ